MLVIKSPAAAPLDSEGWVVCEVPTRCRAHLAHVGRLEKEHMTWKWVRVHTRYAAAGRNGWLNSYRPVCEGVM